MDSLVLFEAGTTNFTTNGLGIISDAFAWYVDEERNGEYELSLEYPINGKRFDDLKVGRLLYGKPNPYASKKQAFEIYEISKSYNGRVVIYAEHLKARLRYIPVMPFTATSCSQALSRMKTYAAEECPFTFTTDKSINSSYIQDVPAPILNRLSGEQGSILQLYKGEYEWDNFNVRLLTNRGTNRGVTLRYGKNIIDIEQEENIRKTITGICPYWYSYVDDVPELVTLPEKVIYSSRKSEFAFGRVETVDFTSEFANKPTQSELRERTVRYIEDNNIGIPKVSINLSFIDLSQVLEYSEYAPLQTVKLCDIINIEYEKLGISTTAKVTKVRYNGLLDRYDSIQIGDVRSSIERLIADQNEEIKAIHVISAEDVQNISGSKANQMLVVAKKYTDDNVFSSLSTYDEGLTQSKIFNRLTNNGAEQGIYLYNGKIYINATYMQTGTLDADLITVKNLITNHLRSYNSGGNILLEGSSGYLDIREYDQAKEVWNQKIGIFRDTNSSVGAIRLSSGDVDDKGEPDQSSSAYSERTFIGPSNISIGRLKDNTTHVGTLRAGSANFYNGLGIGTGNKDGKARISIQQPDGTFTYNDYAPLTVQDSNGKNLTVLAKDEGTYKTGVTRLSTTKVSTLNATVSVNMRGHKALLIFVNPENVAGRGWYHIHPAYNATGDYRVYAGTAYLGYNISVSGTTVTIKLTAQSNSGFFQTIYGI